MLECPFCESETDDWGWDEGIGFDNQGIDWLTCPNCGRQPGKQDIQVRSTKFKFRKFDVNNKFKRFEPRRF